ncbi:unnamed protein product [Toxocara canis]|uniref:Tudor domain-containing protein n=1 Tax=Toxocara canis TaxID=6265 RepID=A0A183V9Y3_TOXCA|nr:unnamed protein product [Toxocara canis]
MAGFAKVSEWNEHCEEPGPSASPSAEGVAGGFRHWPHESALLKRVEDIKLSDCRDMVLVETGTEWRLRQMSELYPDYCWKYAESSVLAYYHYCMAASGDGPVAPSKRPTASLPVFYATLPYEFSPYDFSIQPKCLDKACKQLQEQMQTFYDTHDSPTFSKKEVVATLFIGMACAVNSHGEWRRGKILEYSNAADALIDVVDYGTENLVKTSQIRPLMKEFGRLPPLAMRCRMKDVCINDLTAAKVSAFHELLADCGGLVRVELADVSSIPYRVNLYHPTIEGRNLGSLFYRREVHPEREAARQRRWQARLARIVCILHIVIIAMSLPSGLTNFQNGDDIEDDEDYGSDFEDEPEELPHVKCLERWGCSWISGLW